MFSYFLLWTIFYVIFVYGSWDLFASVLARLQHRGFKPKIFQLGQKLKLKLFWKHHTMKFNIGCVNVEKVYSFYPKNPFKVDLYQINVFFLIKKLKSLTFTPLISNFIAWSFQNSFSFGCSSYQKKGMQIWKKNLYIILLHWFDFTPMVGFLPCLHHVCRLPAACQGCLKFIYRL